MEGLHVRYRRGQNAHHPPTYATSRLAHVLYHVLYHVLFAPHGCGLTRTSEHDCEHL